MAHVLAQVALHRVIQEGVQLIKENPDVLDTLFQYYKGPLIDKDYGQPYIDKIKVWFMNTKIPVVQAWSMNVAQVPQIAIKLASESEDESKAAIGDHFGEDDDSNIGVGVFRVTLDVELHASKNSDEVLWLYYIVNYILFKRKRRAEELGLQISTFSASDFNRDKDRSGENVWIRTIKYTATVENFWYDDPKIDICDMEVKTTFESSSIKTE